MGESERVSRSEEILTAEAERVRGLLRRYLSPRIADAVLDEKHAPIGPGQACVVSILICDLRGYTAFAERTPPIDVVRLLNEFLEEMTQVVFKYDGVLDKYTGDGLIAVFGVPYSQPDHAQRAIHVSLEMQARHEQMIERWAASGRPRLGLGIGIQSGEVIAGNFGSTQRMDYTVIGHAVNLASRLTAVAPAGQVLIGEETRRLSEHLVVTEPLGLRTLKNVSEDVNAHRLLGIRPESSIFCLSCGSRIRADVAVCPRCKFRRDTQFVGRSIRDGLMTAAGIMATLTSTQLNPGPHLIAVAGPHQGGDFPITFPCAIGREALGNQIVLSLDPAISRRHALLRSEAEGAVVLVDLESQNGTYVNNRRIELASIRDGDVLALGRTRLVMSGLRGRLAGQAL